MNALEKLLIIIKKLGGTVLPGFMFFDLYGLLQLLIETYQPTTIFPSG